MHISRNTRIGIAAVAVAAVPITALSLQPTNAASSSASDRTFRLVEREATFRFIDLPPRQASEEAPPSAGDEFVFTSRLLRKGKRVGTLHAVCTFTRRSQDFNAIPASCVGSFVLRRGTIEVQVGGLLRDNLDLAITGGTGAFAGASGVIESRSGGRRTVDIVHLTLP